MLNRYFPFLMVAILVLLPAPSAAGAPMKIECPAGTVWDGNRCSTVIRIVPDAPPTQEGEPKAPLVDRKCFLGAQEVPCSHDWGVFDSARQCYVAPLSPQPPRTDSRWNGREDGVLYACTHPFNRTFMYVFVADEVLPSVSAVALAEQLRASMRFEPVRIGIVPEPGPGSVGLVGLPTWMWVANASPEVIGPQTRSLSSSGVTVTLTAKVTSTRWEMGDGGVVNCSGPGTPYEDRFGAIPSPTCGYKYAKQGTYRVQAFTNWHATWRANTGEQGVFSWRMASATTITMGEAQVVNINR